MASAKANKKIATAAVELPECPVCLDTMTAPIFQCQSGHSLCNSCTNSLVPPICPICRQAMTQMRNWQLEEIVAKAKVPCPNKSEGCVYTMISQDVEDHLKECIFRVMDCPLGAVLGRCSWNGRLKEMMEHFKERHPTHCNVNSDAEVELDNIDIKDDERFVYLTAQGKLLFIITMKIDTLQKMAYWTIQHIGSKKTARQHIYEIHVTSKKDDRTKVVFIDHCFNDAVKADEVFRQAKCGILPLNALKHFIDDKKMAFRFFIKRMPSVNKNTHGKGDDKNDNKNENKDFIKKSGPSGFAPKGSGPKGPGRSGPAPKGPGTKNPGFKGPVQKGPGLKGQGTKNN